MDRINWSNTPGQSRTGCNDIVEVQLLHQNTTGASPSDVNFIARAHRLIYKERRYRKKERKKQRKKELCCWGRNKKEAKNERKNSSEIKKERKKEMKEERKNKE